MSFRHAADAANAIAKLDGTAYQNRTLSVRYDHQQHGRGGAGAGAAAGGGGGAGANGGGDGNGDNGDDQQQ